MKTKFFILFFLLLILFEACSTTKYLKEGENLLFGVTTICDDKSVDVYETENYYRQKPMRTILGMPLHGAIYNMIDPVKADSIRHRNQVIIDSINDKRQKKFNEKLGELRYEITRINHKLEREKDSNNIIILKNEEEKVQSKIDALAGKGYNQKTKKFSFRLFFQNIGEKPIVYQEAQAKKTAVQIKKYMRNKGYYEAQVKDSTVIKEKKHKAYTYYNITANQPITINKIYYNIKEDTLKKYVFLDTVNCILKVGGKLDIDIIQQERSRLTLYLQNNGYYGFSKDYIVLNVDTVGKNHKADLIFEILPITIDADYFVNHSRKFINNVYIFPDYNQQEAVNLGEDYFLNKDTLLIGKRNIYNRYQFIYKYDSTITKKKALGMDVKPRVTSRAVYIHPTDCYSTQNVNDTYRHLGTFNIYKMINIEFMPSMHRDSLDCNIFITQNPRHAYIIELEGTNSSGNLGAGASFTYQNKNIFRGAETFDLKFSCAFESQADLKNEVKAFELNTQEYGLEGKLYFPRILAPRALRRKLTNTGTKTYFGFGANYRERPDYTRNVINGNLNYQWDNNKCMSYVLTPFRLSSISISKADSTFLAWLDKLYIKDAYQDHFILGSSVSVNYNTQKQNKRDYVFLKSNLSIAGNILQLANNLAKTQKQNDEYYNIPLLNVRYAQFFKVDFDFRHYIQTGKNKMVYRLFLGAGIPYGNISQMPFSEQYFSGGANSLRAWQIRSVGPGSYQSNQMVEYPNQTADLKLEANLEYRFKIVWMIEGAWFVDAGNIWSLKNDYGRYGAQISKNFYKELAIGTGLGVRLDFDFFIFRLDFGLKLHDPSLEEKNRWLVKDSSWLFKKDNWAFSLGIGYPF